ncbi:MAG TPA: type II and III secretion system protein, partial [Bdellovibrionota bacterium]|nr:type II and III secretion system protein [Bdellovibrionota bacterium]
ALAGSSDLSGSTGGGIVGLSPSISFLPGVQRINATLSMAESEDRIKVLSSPRLVVLNNHPANITQSTPTAHTQVVSTSTSTTIETVQQDATLQLNVTPRVTNDENVLLDLHMTAQVPKNDNNIQLVANRDVQTNVMVSSGSTLVIGGVFSSRNEINNSGFPVLKDVPILGVLFGSKKDLTSRVELMFFITPRILNSAAAGLTG